MPIWRMQCTFGSDTAFPRDLMSINPHFNDQGVGDDPDGLCEDLAIALAAWPSATRQVTVTAYDAQGSKPVNPAGTHTVNSGATPIAACPREIALCLSYRSAINNPRRRGRLYAPVAVLGGTLNARPTSTLQNKVAELVPIFTGLGGADVDWCVYSPTDDSATAVTDWWVDDEWDTVRSRGLRPTSRISGSVSE